MMGSRSSYAFLSKLLHADQFHPHQIQRLLKPGHVKTRACLGNVQDYAVCLF